LPEPSPWKPAVTNSSRTLTVSPAELLWSTPGLVSLIPGAEAMNTEFAAKAESDDLLIDDPAAGTAIAITAAPAYTPTMANGRRGAGPSPPGLGAGHGATDPAEPMEDA
jgi:hypothetical protein